MLKRVCGFMLFAVAMAAVISLAGAARAEEDDVAPDVKSWDCVVNTTDKWLTVYLSSHRKCGHYTLAPKAEIRFGFYPDTKKMTVVAWEYGKNELVDITAFDTMAQTDPKNPICFPIIKSTLSKAGEKRERHKMEGKKDHGPITSPSF